MTSNKICRLLLLLVLSALANGQEVVETSLLANSVRGGIHNINCNRKIAVCVGPLMYKDCIADINGETFATGSTKQCSTNSRCINDGAEICVPLKTSTAAPMTEVTFNTTTVYVTSRYLTNGAFTTVSPVVPTIAETTMSSEVPEITRNSTVLLTSTPGIPKKTIFEKNVSAETTTVPLETTFVPEVEQGNTVLPTLVYDIPKETTDSPNEKIFDKKIASSTETTIWPAVSKDPNILLSLSTPGDHIASMEQNASNDPNSLVVTNSSGAHPANIADLKLPMNSNISDDLDPNPATYITTTADPASLPNTLNTTVNSDISSISSVSTDFNNSLVNFTTTVNLNDSNTPKFSNINADQSESNSPNSPNNSYVQVHSTSTLNHEINPIVLVNSNVSVEQAISIVDPKIPVSYNANNNPIKLKLPQNPDNSPNVSVSAKSNDTDVQVKTASSAQDASNTTGNPNLPPNANDARVPSVKTTFSTAPNIPISVNGFIPSNILFSSYASADPISIYPSTIFDERNLIKLGNSADLDDLMEATSLFADTSVAAPKTSVSTPVDTNSPLIFYTAMPESQKFSQNPLTLKTTLNYLNTTMHPNLLINPIGPVDSNSSSSSNALVNSKAPENSYLQLNSNHLGYPNTLAKSDSEAYPQKIVHTNYPARSNVLNNVNASPDSNIPVSAPIKPNGLVDINDSSYPSAAVEPTASSVYPAAYIVSNSPVNQNVLIEPNMPSNQDLSGDLNLHADSYAKLLQNSSSDIVLDLNTPVHSTGPMQSNVTLDAKTIVYPYSPVNKNEPERLNAPIIQNSSVSQNDSLNSNVLGDSDFRDGLFEEVSSYEPIGSIAPLKRYVLVDPNTTLNSNASLNSSDSVDPEILLKSTSLMDPKSSTNLNGSFNSNTSIDLNTAVYPNAYINLENLVDLHLSVDPDSAVYPSSPTDKVSPTDTGAQTLPNLLEVHRILVKPTKITNRNPQDDTNASINPNRKFDLNLIRYPYNLPQIDFPIRPYEQAHPIIPKNFYYYSSHLERGNVTHKNKSEHAHNRKHLRKEKKPESSENLSAEDKSKEKKDKVDRNNFKIKTGKTIKELIDKITKEIRNGKCDEDDIYPDVRDCKKYYRCIEKSDKEKFVHLRCGDDKHFDFKEKKCIKKSKAQCLFKNE